jgi:amino acid adenylation domain-containing protein
MAETSIPFEPRSTPSLPGTTGPRPTECNDTEYPHALKKCVRELFEKSALTNPDALAVVCGGRTLTYSELRARAIVLSRELLARGVGQETVVGLIMGRSPELIVSMIAVLCAGAAYLPIDPLFPATRIRFMLDDSNAKVLCSDEASYASALQYSPDVIEVHSNLSGRNEPLDLPVKTTHPDSLAYIMYTSGSTGTPKGVEVLHRGITRLVHGNYARFGRDETFLHLSSPSFDASTLEVWGALLHGGKCVIVPQHVPSVSDVDRVIKENNVTTMWLTASYFNAVIDEAPDALRGIRQLLIGGEALSVRHVRSALAALPGTTIINGYGPTENTTFTCCYTIPQDLDPSVTSIPIGTAISGTKVYVLDSMRIPVADGEEGELYAGGDGVARGYLNRPDLTESLFLKDPFSDRPSAQMYKTGDLVRRRPDGVVEFLGRVDDQVKIRGFRIEPAEVQTVLTQHSSVRAALVLPQTDPAGEKHLVAYVVPAERSRFDENELRIFAEQRLPEFMRPSFYLSLVAIPLNVNGKVDRHALPLPWGSRTEMREGDYSTETERLIARVWFDVLGGRSIGREQNFFEAGARSLHAVRVHARLQGILSKRFAITELFQYPTIRSLAAHLSGGTDKSVETASIVKSRARRQVEAIARQQVLMKRLK